MTLKLYIHPNIGQKINIAVILTKELQHFNVLHIMVTLLANWIPEC